MVSRAAPAAVIGADEDDPTDDDARVGHVERRPKLVVADLQSVDEVDHRTIVVTEDAVSQVADCSADEQAQTDRRRR